MVFRNPLFKIVILGEVESEHSSIEQLLGTVA
jgi:hypothetical protein